MGATRRSTRIVRSGDSGDPPENVDASWEAVLAVCTETLARLMLSGVRGWCRHSRLSRRSVQPPLDRMPKSRPTASASYRRHPRRVAAPLRHLSENCFIREIQANPVVKWVHTPRHAVPLLLIVPRFCESSIAGPGRRVAMMRNGTIGPDSGRGTCLHGRSTRFCRSSWDPGSSMSTATLHRRLSSAI
jgi:hypothetical protein